MKTVRNIFAVLAVLSALGFVGNLMGDVKPLYASPYDWGQVNGWLLVATAFLALLAVTTELVILWLKERNDKKIIERRLASL